ncbi:thioredoxin [Actinokineospora diospyrosa]|uniref:Thioredoxin n=1 Tax=Actinokineospora diospyrosa TaxID=103728 RepID=A0ABT1I8M9_9PSEU|nr:thioredoxin [Actinokineospora diospyrosa]MCP2268989.1 thioredoxin [Actinokineospora diospyrosa]
MITATDTTFADTVLAADGLVLVDFWAQWCPPCHMIAPVLDEIAKERPITVVKVNTDENPGVARDYQVLSLPTLMLFQDGRPVMTLVGARPKVRLLEELDKAVA